MNGILPESQFGFRANRRTSDCLFILNTLVQNAKSNRTAVFACFVDFQNVFDNMNHHILWNKVRVSKKYIKVI